MENRNKALIFIIAVSILIVVAAILGYLWIALVLFIAFAIWVLVYAD
jgi:hypothetical protein